MTPNYKLQRLQMGETFITSEKGNSMTPLIKSGQKHRLEPATWKIVEVGDIVYCKVKGRFYTHKVLAKNENKGVKIDAEYPGTAVTRLTNVLGRLESLPPDELNADWSEVRSKLLWAGGLSEDFSTSHAFNDENHCDLTTMLPDVSYESNEDGSVKGISTSNHLGDHITKASLPEMGEGGTWSTCTNGCCEEPPKDVAHVQFKSRIAFKLVWCPPTYTSFVLVDDLGDLLAAGTPTGELPHPIRREINFALTKGGRYSKAAEDF